MVVAVVMMMMVPSSSFRRVHRGVIVEGWFGAFLLRV